MTTRRIAKLSKAILEQVSTSILFELKDPRVKNVTVTRTELSADAQHAKVYVSILGDEKAEALCLRGLNSARGFLQAKVAARLQTRYTPLLSFIVDPGVKQSAAVSRLLREVLPPDNASEDEHIAPDTEAADNAEPANSKPTDSEPTD